MSMFKSCNFTFDGELSTSYNVLLVDDLKSSKTKSFDFGLSNTSIIEESIPRKEIPYFLGIDTSPIKMDILIIKDDNTEFSKTELFNLKKWLMKRTYSKFISNDDMDIYYNVIFTNPEKVLIGGNKVALSFTMRMDAPYGYITEVVSSHTVTTSSSTTITTALSNYDKNYSNIEIEFTTATGVSDISIENTSDDGRITTFTGLDAGETIYINNKRKELLSDTGLNRFSNFNLTWFRLLPNQINNITITGSCDITFRYSLPILI